MWELLFTQDLAFTAKSVRKRSSNKQKSICEANFAWIFACYWNGANSNIWDQTVDELVYKLLSFMIMICYNVDSTAVFSKSWINDGQISPLS